MFEIYRQVFYELENVVIILKQGGKYKLYNWQR